MATKINHTDIVRKIWVKSILETNWGCGNRDIESFILAIFDEREEMSFCEFVESVFAVSVLKRKIK